MDEQAVSPVALPAAHTVPTHLAAADTVVSLGYLSLSSRQLLLLLVGGSLAVSLWTRTAWLSRLLGPVGAALHLALVIVWAVADLSLTFGQAQGRSLDAWVIIMFAYLARPRLYLWRSLPASPLGKPEQEEERA